MGGSFFGTIVANDHTDIEGQGMNKRKRVALAKHRKKAKKSDEKRKLGALARRTK
jgi:hypothetical protein